MSGNTPVQRLLLFGSTGQIGGDLLPMLSSWATVRAPAHAHLDLTDLAAARQAVREFRPQIIINAAAFTNVDGAEQQRDLAMRLNAELPRVLAEEAERSKALLVHYSTDYVFDGRSSRPYVEDDLPAPVNFYGESKLAGERAILEIGAAHVILRTSWVYGARGRNFFSTIARLSREKDLLEVVDDQTGSPTWSWRVADVTNRLLRRASGNRALQGILHVAGGGQATRFEFAGAVVSRTSGSISRVVPVSSDRFPTPAIRPRYSALDASRLASTFGITMPHWGDEIHRISFPENHATN